MHKGFDDFDLRIGDLMRGERASKGKSLLDVQRELKIKSAYIAAIENGDLSDFENLAFIQGFVRSYARYLGMDPEWAYLNFEREMSTRRLVMPSNQESGPSNRSEIITDFGKRVLFALLYPALLLVDLAGLTVDWITSREAGSSRSFQGVSAETTDWWTFFAIFSGIAGATLLYLSQLIPLSDDWALRLLVSAVLGATIAGTLSWFNPRFFFARLVLLLLVPILMSSAFGARVSLAAEGKYLGGFLEFGVKSDPMTTIVLGILCALAMFFHHGKN